MVKTPTKTPAKAKANAPAAKPAPAKKVETPADPPKPEKTEDAAPEENKPADADNLPPAGAPGVTATNDQADPETAKADGTETAGPKTFSEEELNQAYKDGYSTGFSDALDGEGPPSNEPGPQPQEGDQISFDPEGTAASDSFTNTYTDRLSIVSLALMTPTNQRKGGLGFLVDRLQKFIDGLDYDDRYPALVMMRTIGETQPEFLPNGRYEALVMEGLAALNGDRVTAAVDRAAASQADAAHRLETLGMPEEPDLEAPPDPAENVDLEDPEAGSSAAGRMAGAI